jgi:hypothetical protein
VRQKPQHLQKHRHVAYAGKVQPRGRSLGSFMRIADSIKRNGLDVQMADLERIVGAAVAIEVETGKPVVQRLAEAVARFDGVFVPQKPKVSARRFIQEIQFRRRLRVIQAPKRPASS